MIMQDTCINFKKIEAFETPPNGYLNIEKSVIYSDGVDHVGYGNVRMTIRGLKRGVIMHELRHVLGFMHTQ